MALGKHYQILIQQMSLSSLKQLNPLLVMEPLLVYYDEGIGTRDRLDRLTGGVFGWGIDEAVQGAYRFIAWTTVLRTRDELYLFGFSRGAYTVRSLAGLMSCSGIVSRSDIRDTPEAYEVYHWEEWRTAVQEVSSFPWLSPWTCPDNASWLLGYGGSLEYLIKFPYCRLMSCLIEI